MNSFGRIFRIQLFGESHGHSVGVVIDGCPPGIVVTEEMFGTDLARRKTGAAGTSPRTEDDIPEIVSGVYNGHATGAPIAILFQNKNTQANDYDRFRDMPRPGHADFVAMEKYKGFADLRGGGHFSGRLTVALVAAGVIAKQIIDPVEVTATLIEAGGDENIERNIQQAIQLHDSIGGVVACRVRNLPVGLGEPFFDGLESLISHIVFAIPGIKAIAFGSGFEAAKMRGSEHNDLFIDERGTTATNHAGGINGGISNGNELYFEVAVKPPSSIGATQETFHFKSKKTESLTIAGRHDACFAWRVPPIIEAATAIVLADLYGNNSK